MKKLAYILEMTWLSLSAICLAIALYTFIFPRIKANSMFLVLSIVAFLMYLMRRSRRLKQS